MHGQSLIYLNSPGKQDGAGNNRCILASQKDRQLPFNLFPKDPYPIF